MSTGLTTDVVLADQFGITVKKLHDLRKRNGWPCVRLGRFDIRVDDLAEAGAHAVEAGAVLADFQPQDDVRVYLDPAGHPFCLFTA